MKPWALRRIFEVFTRQRMSPTSRPSTTSRHETTDLGEDTGTSVSDDNAPHPSSFNGKGQPVRIDRADAAEDSDHPITPETRLRIAMSRR